MKRSLAATVLMGAMVLAGCGDRQPEAKPGATETVATGAEAPATAEATPARPAAPVTTGVSAAPNAPAFAVIYPGGTLRGPATVAQGPQGPGGIVEFTTEAEPAAVIAFYRQRAEAAGLKPINTMNRGESMGYAAGDGASEHGQLLSVVATRIPDEPTNVQLTWTDGR